jgi:hypothetical protein
MGWFLKTKTQPKSDRFGLTSLLKGGMFHTCLFPVYFQELFNRPV